MSYPTIHSPPHRQNRRWLAIFVRLIPARFRADINLDPVEGRLTVAVSIATPAAVRVALAHFPSKLPFYLIFTLHRSLMVYATSIMSNNTPDYGTITCNATLGDSTSVSYDYDHEREPVRKDTDTYSALPLLQTCTIILSLSGAAFCSSMTTGLLTVCLPAIAVDLSLPEHLLLW